jgi:prephenate dehydratase
MNVAKKNSGAVAYQRIGFLGPFGTFTEQALRTQPDLLGAELLPYRSVPDVLDAVSAGDVDAGFVPIENSIEGMINFTLDALAFDHELLIQRDVVLDIEHCLLVRPGTSLAEVHTVYSIPVASAQCHRYLREHLGSAEVWAANSTAEAARIVAEEPGAIEGSAAIAPRAAAERYGLEILTAGIEDQAGNQTRFVLVTPNGIPAPTGHDRTALVIYQRADEPGSLISILQEFAARRINLSNLISRPTKEGGLGDYCFIVFAEGHLHDDLLADALRALHTKQGGVKFFGSYPASDASGASAREHADNRWREADDWVAHLRSQISTTPTASTSTSSTKGDTP